MLDKETREVRKVNLDRLYEYHKPTFDALGIKNPFLLGKLFYKPVKGGEEVVAFFESEVSRGTDIYLEKCDKLNVPEDPNRVLYRYRGNPHYEEEYEKTHDGRYMVPTAELQVVEKLSQHTKSTVDKQLTIPDPETDLPIGQMTMRDFAAIMLNKPVSRKEWLNDLIRGKK